MAQPQQIIEMFGDVSKADVIMSFMPGTNTTMESFYSSTADEGLTSLTRRMVEYPPMMWRWRASCSSRGSSRTSLRRKWRCSGRR
ncbi:hypothetical protein CBF90_12775 [Microbacterium sp. AISO3]|nr:hypothetical protein CBF90_12775 [Microbacterium sp. AISO3]